MTTSEKLQKIRRREGLTQEQFAERIGVSRQALSKWESGDALPDAVNLMSISRIFNVSIDRLLNDALDLDEPAPEPSKPHGERVSEWSKIGKKLICRVAGAIMMAVSALIIIFMSVYASVTKATWVEDVASGMSGNHFFGIVGDGVTVRVSTGLTALLYEYNLWWFFWLLIAIAVAGAVVCALPEIKKLWDKRKILRGRN